MPTEATFVLAAILIVFAGLGWAYDRLSRERDNAPPPGINADYFRGLNLVLNRKTDEALELFIQLAKVDDETLETHFALGHLFRRRGEVDRAIRVHQNLLARPSLSEAQRHQALFALAEDYLGAGLFDRAETLFSELKSSETLAQQALEKLIDIYEREKEWEKAIEAQHLLERRTGERSPRVSHYHCELAEEARLRGDTAAAREQLRHAASTESGRLRASLIGAAIAKSEQRHAEAIKLYEQVIESDRRLIAEVLPDLLECHERAGPSGIERFDAYVARLAEKQPELERELAYAAIVGELVQSKTLARCIESFVLSNEILANLVDVDELRGADPARRERAVRRIATALRRLALASARYRCTNCGYSSRRLIWHCPSCKQWETVRPIQGINLEALVP
ncbi:MAG: tetratricopeptide repeat protein [Gammaproteobacteria bacterium]|nr:lipopolysaccharide assembly protein LapB [Gammaproteobacteria bacterium]